jgi:predicted TIM-barrel fold metal-dependent hydrolase
MRFVHTYLPSSSTYPGSSPAPLVDTLQKQHQDQFKHITLRGLATIDPNNITDGELDDLHKQGVRGARFHKMAWGHGAQSGGADIMTDIRAVAERVARLGWVIDVFCPVAAWAYMANAGLRDLDPRIKLVADHFGGTFPGDESSEEFQIFLDLVREGRVSVKLSGFERLYHGKTDGMDSIKPIAKAIIDAGPDQIVYGSDWPHTQLGVSRQGKTDEQRLTEVEGFREVPDAAHIGKLREWVVDDDLWKKLWVENPEKLFG